MKQPVWQPSAEQITASRIVHFATWLEREAAVGFPRGLAWTTRAAATGSWTQLYQWSVENPAVFWTAWARHAGVLAQAEPGGDPWAETGVGLTRMAPPDARLGPRWFPQAWLNFAENLLRHASAPDAGAHAAIVQWNEIGPVRSMSYRELAREVNRVAQALKRAGIGSGSRVAGLLPNIAEAVIAMLASASLGAVWTSCSPDFGVNGVLDRFGQIKPEVLFAAPAYMYAGNQVDIKDKLAQICAALPGLKQVVLAPYPATDTEAKRVLLAVNWSEFIADCDPDASLEFAQLPFDHPLYIMYSSGTTGLPKCLVHGAGGTLLQHLKELALHSAVRAGDRIFYFTTCGWMMWNWLVSSLALGATVVLFDGNPLKPDPRVLWRMADETALTHFGTSAKYLALLEKEGVKPGQEFKLDALRMILSTGSPLAPESFDYVYREIKHDVQLASISGGTDIISCFALGNPVAPVYRGQLQTRGLGLAVEVWNDQGEPVVDEPGELVCVKPFPSMPVAFWNDPSGEKYRQAYYDHFPGVWRHGDWAELTELGGLIIHGRSDATLNPGGVRIGTAEIYQQVEAFPEVLECVAIGQEWEADTRIVLFVRLVDSVALTGELVARLRQRIREQCSPSHVPRKIVAVADIPRTVNGKLSESAVRQVVHDRMVANRDALANPEALALFRDLPELAD
jgi:acetoacetyl-CoA synthetase